MRVFIDADQLVRYLKDKIMNPSHIETCLNSFYGIEKSGDAVVDVLHLVIHEVEARRDSRNAREHGIAIEDGGVCLSHVYTKLGEMDDKISKMLADVPVRRGG